MLLVIAVGVFYVNSDNWNPFLPNGIGGVLKGVSAVFFAYIGFDAISTTAEECKNPQRDLPRGMMWSIILCTILYVAIALVLTGMVPYHELAVGDPLAFVFQKLNLHWLSGHHRRERDRGHGERAARVPARTAAHLDEHEPRRFVAQEILDHPPEIPYAFVCHHRHRFRGGRAGPVHEPHHGDRPVQHRHPVRLRAGVCRVLRLELLPDKPKGSFRTPYVNAQYVFPGLLLLGLVVSFTVYKDEAVRFLRNDAQLVPANEFVAGLSKDEATEVGAYVARTDSANLSAAGGDLDAYVSGLDEAAYGALLAQVPLQQQKKQVEGWEVFKHKIPSWIFLISCLALAVLAFVIVFADPLCWDSSVACT